MSAPAESLIAIRGTTDGLPHIWLVNQALDQLPSKADFGWHLSIIIDMAEQAARGLPTEAEQTVLGEMGDELRAGLQVDDNALFLLNGTWNGQRQLAFRVRDPERVHAYLTGLGRTKPIREFECVLEHDPKWALAEHYLGHARKPHGD